MLELDQICREVVDVANARSALRSSCPLLTFPQARSDTPSETTI
jgi:hypothetical protein